MLGGYEMNQNIKILVEALQNIQSYDHSGDGICPYGCDTPYIAKKALVDFDNAEYASQQAVQQEAKMEVKIVKSVKDDFHEMSGPSMTTHAFLSIDGMLFELGRFYEGPHMNEDTGKRLAKVLEFEQKCKDVFGA
jgi:hypothetical protein